MNSLKDNCIISTILGFSEEHGEGYRLRLRSVWELAGFFGHKGKRGGGKVDSEPWLAVRGLLKARGLLEGSASGIGFAVGFANVENIPGIYGSPSVCWAVTHLQLIQGQENHLTERSEN